MKWYQISPPFGKWHLEDNKCYPRYTRYYQYDRYQPRNLVEATDTPKWSTIPLPDTAMSRICRICWKKAASEQ